MQRHGVVKLSGIWGKVKHFRLVGGRYIGHREYNTATELGCSVMASAQSSSLASSVFLGFGLLPGQRLLFCSIPNFQLFLGQMNMEAM